MRIEPETKLDFCDVLIRPKWSESPSRYNVDLTRFYEFRNSKATWSGVPIIAANMDTVGTMAMAEALQKEEMAACLHKHYSVDKLIDFFKSESSINTFYTLGIKEEDYTKLEEVVGGLPMHPHMLCLDVANGYTKFFAQQVKRLRDQFPNSIIMAGNVATPEMVQELLFGGADIIKIGIGPGSVCTTRLVTGVGYPQFSAIMECADAAHGLKGHICADGGCTTPGDIAKAFGAGADFVMLGGMLSGHDECEGHWVYDDSQMPVKRYLRFYGMSSKEAMEKHSGGQAKYKASEGKCAQVPYKGPVEDTLREITGGLRSACTYVGTEALRDFSKCCTFVKVSRTHNTVYGTGTEMR